MNTVTGYKVYYDVNAKEFQYETTLSEVSAHVTPPDSTTSWFDTVEHAANAVRSLNKDDFVYICKECGSPFYMTDDEKQWYLDRHLYVPKRCWNCRKNKKRPNRTV